MPIRIAFLIVAVMLVFSATASAQITKREQLIKISKELESAPFSEEAKENRGWAVRWVIETDEVSVVICSTTANAAFLDKKNKYSSEIIAQYTIGMAAFKLVNPEQASDEAAAQIAGIESALRAYTAMIAEKPKGKHKGMDDLIAMRDRGELSKDKVAGCGKNETK